MQQCNKRLDPDQGRLGQNIFAKLTSRRQEREILQRHQKRCNRVFKGCLFKVWIKIRAYPLPDLGPNILAKIFSRERERESRAVGIGGGTGGPAPPPPNNLHKYAVLLITKVCHFKKIYVCPPPPPPICKKFMCAPQSVIASYGPEEREREFYLAAPKKDAML